MPSNSSICNGRPFRVESGYSEHFTGTFTIIRGDDWSLDVLKTTVVEKLMHSMSHFAANAEHCTKNIRPWPQVSDRTQKLKAMSFLLQRIAFSGETVNKYFLCMYLPLLACPRRRDQVSPDTNTRTGTQSFRNRKTILAGTDNNL